MEGGIKTSTHEDVLRKVMGDVTEKLTHDLREILSHTLTQTIEQQVSTALTQALLEGEVYRRISSDMRSGLQRIYKEISATAAASGAAVAGAEGAVVDKEHTNKLFHEASTQLSAVLTQTEQATVAILEVVERHMTLQEETEGLLANFRAGEASVQTLERLEVINKNLGEDLNNIMMSLSFQDLTGQRIKRAVSALKEIEGTVVDLYLSTGLLLQAYEESPERSIEEMEAETKQKVSAFKEQSVLESELKGPTNASQKNIDDLLSQLGM